MKLIKRLIFFIAIVSITACSEQTQNEAEDVQQEVKELADATGEDIQNEMKTIEKNMKNLQKELDKKIEMLEAEATKAKAEARKEINQQIIELKEFREQASVKAEDWGKDLKKNFASFENEVQQSLQEAEKWIEKQS